MLNLHVKARIPRPFCPRRSRLPAASLSRAQRWGGLSQNAGLYVRTDQGGLAALVARHVASNSRCRSAQSLRQVASVSAAPQTASTSSLPSSKKFLKSTAPKPLLDMPRPKHCSEKELPSHQLFWARICGSRRQSTCCRRLCLIAPRVHKPSFTLSGCILCTAYLNGICQKRQRSRQFRVT